MPTKTINILLVGLDATWTAENISRDIDFAGIRASHAALAQIPGLHHAEHELIPEDEQTFVDFRNKLIAGPGGGQAWDGVSFGSALIHMERFTPLFERIANMARENAPGAKLLFPPGRGKSEVTIRRNFELPG